MRVIGPPLTSGDVAVGGGGDYVGAIAAPWCDNADSSHDTTLHGFSDSWDPLLSLNPTGTRALASAWLVEAWGDQSADTGDDAAAAASWATVRSCDEFALALACRRRP